MKEGFIDSFQNFMFRIGLGNGAHVSPGNKLVRAHFLTEREVEEVKAQIGKDRQKLDRATAVGVQNV